MKLTNKMVIFSILVIFFSLNILSLAMTIDEIIDKMEENSPDFTTQKTTSEMIVIDEKGKEEVREAIMFSQKEDDDTTSSLIRFLSPKSVKGVTLLNIKNGEKIYLYLPAYDKPRRIAGASKQEEFMGTGLSYEDMSMDYQDKEYTKSLLEETEEEYKIEVIPLAEDTSYKKIILWVDKDKFYAKKVEFYSKNENLTKILEIHKIETDEKGKITPLEIEFSDLENKKKTKIIIKEMEYDIELPADFFSIRTLTKPTL